jgi:hypothetical protein
MPAKTIAIVGTVVYGSGMSPRTLTVGTVTAVGTASAALLAYLLFVSRRNLVHTGDAHLQHWVSPDAARWVYLAIALILVGGFIATTALGARPSARPTPRPTHGARPVAAPPPDDQWVAEAAEARPWRIGAGGGAVAGLAIGLATLATGAVASTVGPLTAPVIASYLAALVGGPLIGGLGARATGRAGSGVLAGLWFGLLLALLAGLALLARDVIFEQRLVSGAWLHDQFGDELCNNTTGDTLAACELGDSLGAMVADWLTFPLLCAGLGGLGGLIGKAAALTNLPSPGRFRPAVVAPFGLGALLFVVFIAEAAVQLW